MNGDRWTRLEALVDTATTLAPEARRAFLDKECSGDSEMRREVESLLARETRVEGFLEKVSFKEGSTVKAGQLLVLIDQRPYKAALQDTKGQLAQAQAALGKAVKDVERLKPLVAADAAPKQDLDKAEAEAEYNRASIEKGKAAVAKAELDLKLTEIRAPITGTIGKEEVTAGNLATKDKNPSDHPVFLGSH